MKIKYKKQLNWHKILPWGLKKEIVYMSDETQSI